MLTLAQLRTFTTVAHLNSFSRAAEVLHLTQPAVSAQIQALEEALKVQLFDRNGKQISLSGAGHIVLEAAEEVATRLARMGHELADLRHARAGHLTVGASQSVGSYLLPDLLAAFSKEYPGIEISVRIELVRRAIDMLVDGDVAERDGGYPFLFEVRAPVAAAGRTNFTLSAVAESFSSPVFSSQLSSPPLCSTERKPCVETRNLKLRSSFSLISVTFCRLGR